MSNINEPSTGLSPDATISLRPFFTLWSGQALSLVGSQTVQFALVWWLTVETGSAVVLTTATLAALVPRALGGAFIGTLVDRWNRRLVLLVSDVALAMAAVVLALLFAAGVAQPWHVLALIAVRGVGSAFHEAAMLATTSLMVPERALTRVQGLNQAVQGLMTIVSAPIGALLVAFAPMTTILLVDVATAALAIAPLFMVDVPEPDRTDSDDGGASVWRETLDGVRFLAARGGHLALLGIAASVNLFLTPAFALLPLLVHEGGAGATQLGWATSAIGLGLLAGGLALGVWGGFRRRMVTSLGGLVLLGLAVLATIAVPVGSIMFLAAVLLVGATSALVNGPIQATIQATIPPEMQGRVFALYGSLATLAAPVGLALAGPVADRLGIGSWYVAGGGLAIACGLLGLALPVVRDLDCAEPDPTSVDEGITASRSAAPRMAG